MTYLKPKDVSKILGIGMNNTYKLFNLKGFPKIQIGRKLLVAEEDFNKYLSQYRTTQIHL